MEDAGALAWQYIQIDDKKTATKRINELESKNKESFQGLWAQTILAEIYLLQKEYEKFEECFTISQSLNMEYGISDMRHRKDRMLGIVCENKNNYEDAIKHYEAALHERPD